MFSFQAGAIRRFKPLFDRILVERFTPELKTKGGVLIPEKAQAKVLDATVVAVGSGARKEVKGFYSFISYRPVSLQFNYNRKFNFMLFL